MSGQKTIARASIFVLCLMFGMHALMGELPAKPGRVYGQVIDDAGASIGNASIFVRPYTDEKVELAGHSDRSGNFTLTLSPGAYDILVTSKPFKSEVKTIVVQPGKNTIVEWKLAVESCDFPGMNCDPVY